jgi:hypothetical protein
MPEPLNLSTPLAYALAYAALGWHVLPLEPRAKQPLGRLVPRGMLDATLDTETIHRWWKVAPAAGVGIALQPSGLVAIDVDPRNGGTDTFDALQAEHGSLRSDVMALTGGNGEHHVFVVPPGAQISLPGTLGPGVDLKANGYIVVEPSVHPSGRTYGWEASSNPLDGVVPSPLPDWLRSLRVDLRQPTMRPGDRAVDPKQARDAREAIYLLNADDYDEWLRAGMALHSTGWGHPAYAMWCAWSQQSNKFDATVSRNKWESFSADRSGGLTLAWIFGEAQRRGWANPAARVSERPQDAREGDARPTPPHGDERPSAGDPVPLLTIAQLKEKAQSVEWLVKGFIPSESIGLFFGASETFKSFIALDLGLHVAHGMKWMGKKTVAGVVVYIAAEGGLGLYRRVDAWHRHHGIVPDFAKFYALPVPVDLLVDASRVRDAVTALGVTPALVVIDTVSQTFSGEENSATEMAAYIREVGLQFRLVWQCAVVAIHHTGHVATERPRGSSAIKANVDFMYGVFRDENEMIATFECVRQKDGDRAKPESFSMTVVELGKDRDGDPITSLAASRVADSAVVDLMEYEARRGRGGKNHLFLELALNGMEEDKVRRVFYESIDGLPDAKKQAYHRCRKWAVSNGIVEIKDGIVIRLKGDR